MLLLVLVLLSVGHCPVGACLFCSMGVVYPPNVVVVVWGGFAPPFVRRHCPNAADPGLPPHQIARGGRDLGGLPPQRSLPYIVRR